MSDQFAGADSLREFLTGASSDGAAQTDPLLSLGNYRSATEAVSLGIAIANAIPNVTILYAGGGNPQGAGILEAVDANNLTWKPFGASVAGPAAAFSGTEVKVVEASSLRGRYLRVQGTTPFTPGQSTITLTNLMNNVFGMDDHHVSDYATGKSEYRATIIRNESSHDVLLFKRWVATLGTVQTCSAGLGASGSGTIVTAGTFATWPSTGWCQVFSSGGTFKEVVYYSSRNNTVLTVPTTGRALLGSTATAGSATDLVYPVPGIALAMDSTGVVNLGNSIQTIANVSTAPTGVTWNKGITAATGLQIGTVAVGKQVGIWQWRRVPANAIATPRAVIQIQDSFVNF